MYNVALEWVLGFRVRGASFVLDPCIPRAWPKFEISFRYRATRYDITVANPLGVSRGVIAAKLDGETLTVTQKALIPLVDDDAEHSVKVVLG
jgi:cyclic beta-1,2-glucan synthetase